LHESGRGRLRARVRHHRGRQGAVLGRGRRRPARQRRLPRHDSRSRTAAQQVTTGGVVREPRVRGTLVARNALLNMAGLGVPLLVAFVTLPIMIRGLGTERFGVFAIVWMLLTYLS